MNSLARNLFLKLCKPDKHRRYDIQSALMHPWITRCTKTQIPLTLIDKYSRKEMLIDFKTVRLDLI
jgi:serine/threonine protein kinase